MCMCSQVCEEAVQHAQLKREGKVAAHDDFVFVKERYQLPGDGRVLPGSLAAASAPAGARAAGGRGRQWGPFDWLFLHYK
jgi:hypothetical protein